MERAAAERAAARVALQQGTDRAQHAGRLAPCARRAGSEFFFPPEDREAGAAAAGAAGLERPSCACLPALPHQCGSRLELHWLLSGIPPAASPSPPAAAAQHAASRSCHRLLSRILPAAAPPTATSLQPAGAAPAGHGLPVARDHRDDAAEEPPVQVRLPLIGVQGRAGGVCPCRHRARRPACTRAAPPAPPPYPLSAAQVPGARERGAGAGRRGPAGPAPVHRLPARLHRLAALLHHGLRQVGGPCCCCRTAFPLGGVVSGGGVERAALLHGSGRWAAGVRGG